MSENATSLLKARLQQILNHKNLSMQRELILEMTAELNIDVLDYCAALLYLTHAKVTTHKPTTLIIQANADIKMLRYRLAVGTHHQISIDALKKLLVEESGVDIKYLNYFNIQADYTIVELPDAMPIDIFQHLKTVEINGQKLAIKRLKPRATKKRGKHHLRRSRPRNPSN